MTKGKCTYGMIGYSLVIIGALNWGLVGVGHFFESNLNVVNLLLGSWPTVEAIVYILVGVSAIVALTGCRCGSCCEVESPAGQSDSM